MAGWEAAKLPLAHPRASGGWSQCQGISVADTQPKSATAVGNRESGGSVPGSASSAHPRDGIPLPSHGFETLDDIPASEPATVPAVISHTAVVLMSASAERLGLSPDGEVYIELDEARPLITALAALLAASRETLGEHFEALHNGLRTLQERFREVSRTPDEPGHGPGETYLS